LLHAKQKTRHQGFDTHPMFPLPMLKPLRTAGTGFNAQMNTHTVATHFFCVTDSPI